MSLDTGTNNNTWVVVVRVLSPVVSSASHIVPLISPVLVEYLGISWADPEKCVSLGACTGATVCIGRSVVPTLISGYCNSLFASCSVKAL